MSWTAVIGVGGSLLGGLVGSNAGEDAAEAYEARAREAQGQITRYGDQARTDVMPWQQAGQWALGQQQDFLRGDYGDALKSPFYTAAYDEGLRALTSGHAAEGNLWGGGADADRIQFGQGMASQGLLTHYGMLDGMSNSGLGAAGTMAQVGMNTGNALAGLTEGIGQTQASAHANRGNQWNNALSNIGGWWGYGQSQRRGGG